MEFKEVFKMMNNSFWYGRKSILIYNRGSYIFRQRDITPFILERDSYTCQICGVNEIDQLHVHHLVAVRRGGTCHPDNLITLCERCHKQLRSDKASARFYSFMMGKPMISLFNSGF